VRPLLIRSDFFAQIYSRISAASQSQKYMFFSQNSDQNFPKKAQLPKKNKKLFLFFYFFLE